MKFRPFAHQTKSLKHSEKSDIVFDCSSPGCVSADTEFLTPTGWKRIDCYTLGDAVAQFHPDSRSIEFVAPLEYVKKPCNEMIAIAPARGMSQRLSAEHRVLYYMPNGTHAVCSAAEFMRELHTRKFESSRKFCTTFSVLNRPGIQLSDEEIRLMVAVIADGTFNPSGSNYCVVRLKKLRKIERLIALLKAANSPYQERVCGGDPDFLVYSFNAPRREKEFTSWWWGANQQQLEIIADELQYWDSSVSARDSKGVRFSSFISASAEFAQYAFAAAKKPASLNYSVRDRTDEGRGTMQEYTVHARSSDSLIGPGRKDSVFMVPNPEGFKYCFEVPSSFLLLRHNGYIFATGNTGKTFVRIKTFERRRKQGAGKALILAPKSLLKAVWAADFKKFAPGLKTVVAYASNRKQAFAEDADVYITNIDATKWIASQPKKLLEGFDELIIDESTSVKNHTSLRSRATAKIAKRFKFRACMTGTPNSNGICDVWHQAYVLDDGKRLGNSYYAFRNQVCEATQVGPNPHAVKWADKEGAEEAVFSLLSDITIRHKFEDCVDIPPNHQYSIPYELSPKHRNAYDELWDTSILQIYGDSKALVKARLTGKPAVPTAAVTAMHAGVLANKLMQLSSGAVYESENKYHVIDTGRYEMILDLIEEREHSLCFFFWKHQRDALTAEADKRGVTFAVIDGSTSDDERNDIVKRYQNGAYRTIFAHPKSAAHGLTLTRGTATIWPQPTYDLEIFKQGSQRQYRMGQTQKTETIIVTAEDTMEQKVMEALSKKDERMSNLLNLFGTL